MQKDEVLEETLDETQDVTIVDLSDYNSPEKVEDQSPEEPSEAEQAHNMNYAYANRTGIFFLEEKGSYKLIARENFSPNHFTESLRYLKSNLSSFESVNENQFSEVLEKHFSQLNRRTLEDGSEFFERTASLKDVIAELDEPEDLLQSQDEAPVIRLLNAIFFEALRERASDIHFEPYEKSFYIRFRVDGILKSSFSSSPVLAAPVTTRLKVLSKLDIAEKRVPQDGRISLKIGNRSIDIRVSTIPSAYGERAVLRILDKSATMMSLESLGMQPKMLQTYQQEIMRPNGIILVTGPTGSGKSTTLYASIDRLDRKKLNIMTIEDPVEYYFDGISQSQVNMKAGMTFARGLRSILRQDPDVVMIGEIRDKETAEIAIQASLTGHLVLSTLHTNSSLGSIVRLLDMGVESYLLASTINCVLAQRLVRKLCEECKTQVKVDKKTEILLQNLFGSSHNITKTWKAKGCQACNDNGYRGRIALYEMVSIDDHIKTMITINKSELDMENYAFNELGSKSLKKSALDAIEQGFTSVEEAVRVV